MVRKIITIDEDLCTGCGDCLPGCPEGAIQLIDGKARLISDLFCDGLGACLGTCPVAAITVIEREAEPYSEKQVMENIIKQGNNVVRAHLKHLEDHGETAYLATAREVLKEKGISIKAEKPQFVHAYTGCPGSRPQELSPANDAESSEEGSRASQLSQWPVQLHLLSPQSGSFSGTDVLLAADCVAFAVGDFHKDFLKGKQLAIACPKLDEGQDVYLKKIRSLVDDARINTLTVMMMQVPCCGGLLRLAQSALKQASRKIPLKTIIISIRGEVLREEWV